MPQTVSVCIPTRNRAVDLAERFRELHTQTWKDFEIVILDDASEDATPETVERAREMDARIRYVRLERPVGVPEIVERCLAEARSDWVAIFHDHDAYRPDAVERLARALESAPDAALAFCGVRTIDPVTGEVRDDSSDLRAPRVRGDVAAHFVRTGSSLVGASAVIVRRDRLPRPAFDRSLGLFADVGLWCRLALDGPVAYEPGPLVDVVGWTEDESLRKANWRIIGALGRLRIEVARELATSSPELAGTTTTVRIRIETLARRLEWSARVLRHALSNRRGRRATTEAPPGARAS